MQGRMPVPRSCPRPWSWHLGHSVPDSALIVVVGDVMDGANTEIFRLRAKVSVEHSRVCVPPALADDSVRKTVTSV
jgi:hypothetical protein